MTDPRWTAPPHEQNGPKHPYHNPAAPDFKQVDIEDFLSDPADDESHRFLSGAAVQAKADALAYAKAHPGTDGAKSALMFRGNLSEWVQTKDAAPDSDTVALATAPVRFLNRAPYPLPALNAGGTAIDGNAFSANIKTSELLGIFRDMLARDIRNNTAAKSGTGVMQGL